MGGAHRVKSNGGNGSGGGDDEPEDRRLLEGRMYNLILEVLQGLNKVAPSIERLSRTLYDFLPMVETKHDYLIGEQRNHNADVKAALASALSSIERDRKDLIEQIIAIRTATALAADNAGDAKNAANEARREATGQPPHEKDTPDSAKGVSGAVVKGLGVWGKMGARAQVLLILLAMVVSAAVTVVAYERLQRPPAPEPPPPAHHFVGPRKE